MSEVDYQLALLLQHKYEQEQKDKEIARALQETYEAELKAKNTKQESHLDDSLLARTLQEQFQKEYDIERPSPSIAYAGPSNSQSTRSLTDPSWEVIDPTPDIHNLFMVFNERFFWNQLGSVHVCWSKRMTTCAGVCSYEGRGGMCTISLSEPLLKLRPRKDLVETLLHEMIHAYLFITNNNRDRDGHGPEFHKHMHRINQEAGTKITVYHDFHDEVRLYQQHWWKCNGPCQNWKPYFGMVRRAMNRAPGPTDRWWNDHSQRCGGQFIKVKEPEKAVKSKPEPKKDLPDIRKFFTPTKPESTNIKSINNNSNQLVNKVVSNSNIFGFTNLDKTSKSEGKVVNNDSTSKKTISSFNPEEKNTPDDNKDYSVVRNHWVNKYSNIDKDTKALNTNSKRPASDPTYPGKDKVPKIDKGLVGCPNCSKKFKENEINEHLDKCLENNSCDIDIVKYKECEVCQKKVTLEEYGNHVNQCLLGVFDDIEKKYNTSVTDADSTSSKNTAEIEKPIIINDDSSMTKCLACNKKILKSDLNDHLEDCLNLSNIFDNKNEPFEGEDSTKSDDIDKINSSFNCPVCMKLIEEEDMNSHIDLCLNIQTS